MIFYKSIRGGILAFLLLLVFGTYRNFANAQTRSAVQGTSSRELIRMAADRVLLIDELVQTGISEGKLPGCVICVGRKNEILLLKAFGNKRLEPSIEAMTVDTVLIWHR